jgi:hypothetical protein
MIRQIFQSNDVTTDYSIDRLKYNETTNSSYNIPIMKKWYGSNGSRDASYITSKRKVNQVGSGTLNPSIATNTPKNVHLNDVNNALTRVRAGGSVAPTIKRNTHGVGVTPTFPVAPLFRSKKPIQEINKKMLYKPNTPTNLITIQQIQNKMAMMNKPNTTNVPQRFH